MSLYSLEYAIRNTLEYNANDNWRDGRYLLRGCVFRNEMQRRDAVTGEKYERYVDEIHTHTIYNVCGCPCNFTSQEQHERSSGSVGKLKNENERNFKSAVKVDFGMVHAQDKRGRFWIIYDENPLISYKIIPLFAVLVSSRPAEFAHAALSGCQDNLVREAWVSLLNRKS